MPLAPLDVQHEIQQPEQHRELDESHLSPLRWGIDLRMGELRRQPPQVDDLHRLDPCVLFVSFVDLFAFFLFVHGVQTQRVGSE